MDKPWGRPAALSAGSITGGVLVLVAATWVLPADFATVGPGPYWLRLGAVIVTALVVAVLGVVGFVGQYLAGFPGTGTVLAALGAWRWQSER